jgi:hypothetical protein
MAVMSRQGWDGQYGPPQRHYPEQRQILHFSSSLQNW